MKNPQDKVSIRPGVNILSVLSRLNYKPWYALAEFVDNSIQSFIDNKTALKRVDGKNCKLRIKISYSSADGGILRIKDNAGGILDSQFRRAFRAAEVPPDTSGLNEYGMGMKSAACWFSPLWTVRTKAIGSNKIKTVAFDINKILEDKIEELDVHSETADKNLHFTELTLRNLHRPLHGKTVQKIRSHLASIYRIFLCDNILELDLDGPLYYERPRILKAPHFKNSSEKAKLWRTELDIKISNSRRVTGFAAIREKGSTAEAGFALFRKGRLVYGSHDETWRPQEIFGAPNQFAYQRVFGELHLTGFDVSHTKDGIVWANYEEQVIEELKHALTKKTMDILGQAEEYRATLKTEDISRPVTRALQRLGPSFDKKLSKVLEKHENQIKSFKEKSTARRSSQKDNKIEHAYSVKFRDQTWELKLSFRDDKTSSDFVEFFEEQKKGSVDRYLTVVVNTGHPFYVSHVGSNPAATDVVARYTLAFAISETLARDGGISKAGVIRMILNDVIRKAFV